MIFKMTHFQHAPSHLHNGVILPLRYTILLWIFGNECLSLNTILVEKITKDIRFILTSSITSQHLNSLTIFFFNHSLELLKDCKNLRLELQK